MWTVNFQMLKLVLEKIEEPEIKLPISIGSSNKEENSRKTSTSALLTKPLTAWITTNCGKFLKRWEYQNTLPASWEASMQFKKQQLEPDMEQQTGSRLGKEYVMATGTQEHRQDSDVGTFSLASARFPFHTHLPFCYWLQISEKYGLPVEKIAKLYKKSKKG